MESMIVFAETMFIVTFLITIFWMIVFMEGLFKFLLHLYDFIINDSIEINMRRAFSVLNGIYITQSFCS